VSCRDTVDACDVVEHCDGVSLECPLDERAMCAVDAGRALDSGLDDAGVDAGTRVEPDATRTVDAGSEEAVGSGCACETAAHRAAATPWLALVALLSLLATRRRIRAVSTS
jgi:MYXO-CTERM domain-containing protein